MTTFYKVGKIVNTQGLRGEVRVISTTDFEIGRASCRERVLRLV